MGILSATPLTTVQLEQFTSLVKSLNKEQLAWTSGYLAALSSVNLTPENESHETISAIPHNLVKLTILFGSRTGNGEGLAKKAGKLAAGYGLDATIKSMEDYHPRELQSEKNLMIIVSTHGEGEAPFAAKELHKFLFSKRAPKYENLNYAVMALGDSSYFHFCRTGKDFDTQLENLGAKRLTEMASLDVDYALDSENWLKATLPAFGGDSASVIVHNGQSDKTDEPETYTKSRPYMAEILEKINLNGRESDRKTLHIELNADVAYEPGDSAAIMPVNDSGLVNGVLRVTRLHADDEVEINGKKRPLSEALKHDIELSRITVDVIKRITEFSPGERLAEIARTPDKLQEYIYGRDIEDLFTDFPVRLSAQTLVSLLRPLQPRLYSISSSPIATPGEIHLTVGVVEYENEGRNRRGACSGYLDVLDSEENKVPVFIQKNPDFRLPANDQTPIIMVGAGTGVAPYRAFIQHRGKAPQPGKSWLFFGNRNFESEFFYQTEWQKFLKSGALTKMHVAFSRDSEKRIYVQHKMAENAAEIFQWLEDGAHFYICGDMKKMATDVQKTLVTIIEKQGNRSKESANEYISQLQKEKRLQLDVY
jgi:sulfite reductase (NADPH) flavoprotein alpha-component